MGIRIPAVLLAAGLSSRMGCPKLLLPWGKTTVIGQVVATFTAAGVGDIVIVTGGMHEQVDVLVAELAKKFSVRAVYNPDYELGEMLSSIQTGLAALDSRSRAALIGLGDQPQMRETTVRNICTTFRKTGSPLVIPSFQNRRGHPWLAAAALWPEIMKLPFSTNPRQFLNSYTGKVEYVAADESILQDLDTPEEYARQRP